MPLDLDATQSFYGDALRMPVSTNPMGFLEVGLPQGGALLVSDKPALRASGGVRLAV